MARIKQQPPVPIFKDTARGIQGVIDVDDPDEQSRRRALKVATRDNTRQGYRFPRCTTGGGRVDTHFFAFASTHFFAFRVFEMRTGV